MIIKPPQSISVRQFGGSFRSIFLAGSIEMGTATDWQTVVAEYLCSKDNYWTIFNPRRDNWDNSLEQTIENPLFYQQVNWELNALKIADTILMYFDPNTISPITLLELGLYAESRKIRVVCPEGYFRKGNVDMVCNIYNIPQFLSINDYMISIGYADYKGDN